MTVKLRVTDRKRQTYRQGARSRVCVSVREREKKMSQLLPVLKALVLDMKKPLVEGEIDRTKEYAKQIAAKLKSG